MHIKSLNKTELTALHNCFTAAFTGYFVPMQLTYEQFCVRFNEKLALQYALSAGAYHDNGRLVGFIFTSIGQFGGKLSAYNAGTGVLPAYRGQSLTSKMYAFLFGLFAEAGIEQCILEVIVANHAGIKSYRRSGFDIVLRYKCFHLPGNVPLQVGSINQQVSIKQVPLANWHAYEALWQVPTDYSSAPDRLNKQLGKLHLAEAWLHGQLTGYIIFSAATGRIEHLAVHPNCRQQGIGSALLQYALQHLSAKSMSLLNVSEHAAETVGFFLKRGFVNHLDQYLMQRPIA